MEHNKRVGIFGWGLVAPKSPDIKTFENNLATAESWLEPFREYGPNNFLVGYPSFDFERYKPWFDARFAPSKFSQLKEKMGPNAQYAMASFIQALETNPGMEQYLQELGIRAHVYVGTGLGDVQIQHEESVHYDRAKRRWNAFWGAAERCSARRDHENGNADAAAPPSPSTLEVGSEEWYDAKGIWDAYWAAKSESLREYLADAAVIQGEPVPPSSGSAKLSTIRQKLNGLRALNKKWNAPQEPWTAVSSNYLWNIANVPASQISMIGKIMGPAFAPIAACASFGVALKMAWDAIQLDEADAVVIGMTDPPPHEVVISAFYNANVLSADTEVSRPLTGLKGTHVSGGSCVWIVGDADKLTARGFKPVGLEIVAVGTSSDAHHIITPSKAGPQLAMQQALRGIDIKEMQTWDMHATATPGDCTEVANSLELLNREVMFTARKGTFGHGMSVGGGWELTAQHLGVSQGKLYPAVVTDDEMHADVKVHEARFVQRDGCNIKRGFSGKLSMGIGGINSCVISRPWES
jgi:3-oxoacyl-[acyl-carrier-protein] synthase II